MGKSEDVEDFRKRCLKLLTSIRRDFSDLEGVKVRFIIGNIKVLGGKASMWASWLFGIYIIKVDYEKWKNATDKQITGGLAHELCHCAYFKKTNIIILGVNGLRYYTSRKFFSKFETENDLSTIRRGYGNELLASTSYRLMNLDKKGQIFKLQHYLSPKEIKFYLKKYKQK